MALTIRFCRRLLRLCAIFVFALPAGAAAAAQIQPAPAITAIAPTASGYAIVGHAFGSERRHVAVIENGVVLPPAAILSLTDSRIEVRSAPAGTVAVSVRVGGRLSTPMGFQPTARPPTIAAVAPTAQGYAILGTGFGADRTRVMVAENNAVLPPSALIALADNRIDVRSAPAGPVSIAVRAHGAVSATYSYQPAGGAAPAIAGIAPAAQGYTIIGRGFGAERGRVLVVENGVVLPPSAIEAASDSRIDVRSAPAGAATIAVISGTLASAPFAYRAAVQRPVIAAVAPTERGYAISGSFFGTDRMRVQVAQNDYVLPHAAVLSVADNRIEVSGAIADAALITVRAGSLASAPFSYRAAPRPPVIASVVPMAQGYAILGSGFGTDRSAVLVAENNVVLPPGAIASVVDGRIEVRSGAKGEIAVAVRVGSLASQAVRFGAARQPVITAILRTTQGYAILGHGFGTDRARVQVAEDRAILPRSAILRIEDGRIDVRSPLRGAVTIAVRVGQAASAGFAFRAAGRAPAITLAVPTPRGYTIVGSGFGSDPSHVVVIENDVVLPHAAIASLSDGEIVVRSKTAARRVVKVQVAGMTSSAATVPAPLRSGSAAAH